ncbi:MAG: LpxL/LpxP family Kdo(2)-lipid IV(A) lauroyl/palmitoleoyl acyltransferase [Gammaproteobacteria bacterium]|nr:LpxL/LpxP family Kdo(2)-lipid IV(A) lauroyl/palmitoleoyl acyltransferase [Gammaproteobacteria bacterium]
MPKNNNTFPVWSYIHPKYWFTWLGLLILRLCVLLPLPALILLGKLLGNLSFYLAGNQRKIARTNIRLCFPQLTDKEHRQLTKSTMQSTGIAVFETALSWWGGKSRLHKLYQVEGLENLKAAQQQGKGILLLGGHYTTLDISGNFLEEIIPDLSPTYKPAHNKLFEAVMLHSRGQLYKNIIPSRDMRTIIRTLKQKGTVWYAPDQDFGREGSVFAPFMGVETATLTITARLARLSGATVVPYSSRRRPDDKGYIIRLDPVLENFPSNDEIEDATQINQAIANNVQLAPEQYLWVHRRFKTRPAGEPQLYPLRRDKRLKRYSKALALLTLPAIAYTLWMSWRHHDKKYLQERLGLFNKTDSKNNNRIWIHAASVGEVNAVIPLVKLLVENHPEQEIIFTTATPTGQQAAINKLPAAVECHYLPIDWWRAVRNFIAKMNPRCVLIVETEIWPNLYEACFKEGIPIIIINGRLSSRTLDTGGWIRMLYCKAMESVYTVLARSEEDAKGFMYFNLPEDKIKVIGNIKFSTKTVLHSSPITLDRPYVLLASSRESEEKTIVETWLTKTRGKHLLVIVPRHPKRLAEIIKELTPLTKNIAVRSKDDSLTEQTQVYIADTFGELPSFIAGSEFVIMGGAFANKGGQNILEAAQQSKAVIFGPHMTNFKDEARLFLLHNAGIQTENQQELDIAISELLDNQEKSSQLGKNGYALIQQHSNIAQQYLDEIKNLDICLKN